MAGAVRLIDLTQPIDSQMPMFPGLPPLEITELLGRVASRERYTDGAEFLIQRFGIAGNTGTYIDTPFHRYPDGADLSQLSLESTVGLRGVVIDARDATTSGRRRIDSSFLGDVDLRNAAVLFWTAWDERWGQKSYLEPNPFLCAEVAEQLVASGVRLVGIDTWNLDDITDMCRPAHSILLRAGIPIIENLCHLERLPDRPFDFHAAPLPIRSGSAMPVRAYAVCRERENSSQAEGE